MKNISGIKFGRLLAISPCGKTKQGGYIWECKCDCGKEHKISSSLLVHGGIKSCGCLEKETNKLISRVGEKFGKLTIIAKADGHRKKWVVRCECGVEKIVRYGNLKNGCTKSCGCWKSTGLWVKPGNKKEFGVAAMNTILDGYKRGAKERNLTWNISIELFKKITKSNCYYCGIEPYRRRETKDKNGHYIFNGIDRVDNNIGYEVHNVVPCCKTCNRAKDIMTQQEFIAWAKRIAANFISNKYSFYENENKIEEIWAKTN